MAEKLTAKQAKFVAGIAKGLTQSDAYRAAYNVKNTKPKSVWESASALAADPKVASRLFELQEAAKERCLVTIESVTAELEEARELARSLEQANAMIQSSMGKAKVNGLLVEKQEVKSRLTINLGDDVEQL